MTVPPHQEPAFSSTAVLQQPSAPTGGEFPSAAMPSHVMPSHAVTMPGMMPNGMAVQLPLGHNHSNVPNPNALAFTNPNALAFAEFSQLQRQYLRQQQLSHQEQQLNQHGHSHIKHPAAQHSTGSHAFLAAQQQPFIAVGMQEQTAAEIQEQTASTSAGHGQVASQHTASSSQQQGQPQTAATRQEQDSGFWDTSDLPPNMHMIQSRFQHEQNRLQHEQNRQNQFNHLKEETFKEFQILIGDVQRISGGDVQRISGGGAVGATQTVIPQIPLTKLFNHLFADFLELNKIFLAFVEFIHDKPGPASSSSSSPEILHFCSGLPLHERHTLADMFLTTLSANSQAAHFAFRSTSEKFLTALQAQNVQALQQHNGNAQHNIQAPDNSAPEQAASASQISGISVGNPNFPANNPDVKGNAIFSLISQAFPVETLQNHNHSFATVQNILSLIDATGAAALQTFYKLCYGKEVLEFKKALWSEIKELRQWNVIPNDSAQRIVSADDKQLISVVESLSENDFEHIFGAEILGLDAIVLGYIVGVGRTQHAMNLQMQNGGQMNQGVNQNGQQILNSQGVNQNGQQMNQSQQQAYQMALQMNQQDQLHQQMHQQHSQGSHQISHQLEHSEQAEQQRSLQLLNIQTLEENTMQALTLRYTKWAKWMAANDQIVEKSTFIAVETVYTAALNLLKKMYGTFALRSVGNEKMFGA